MIDDLLQTDQEVEALIEENARLRKKVRKLELLESKRYRAIVEDQTELICRFKADGTLTFVNGAYCNYFGKSYDELVGKSFAPVIPEEDIGILMDALAKMSPENPVVTVTHRVILESGEVRWQRWVDRGFYDEDGAFIEAQAVGRDITKKQKLREQIDIDREKAEEKLGLVRQHLSNSAEIERLKIAHELHDGPLQTLLSLTFMIDDLRDDLVTESATESIDALRQHILNICQSLRATLTMLRPPGLIEMGLHSALNALLQEIKKKQPSLIIHEHLMPSRSMFSNEIALCIYRIANEAINNVIKHAKAENLYISLIDTGGIVRLEVRDDGVGYDSSHSAEELTRTHHFGIAGMQERAAWIGADLSITASPGNGTNITLTRRQIHDIAQ